MASLRFEKVGPNGASEALSFCSFHELLPAAMEGIGSPTPEGLSTLINSTPGLYSRLERRSTSARRFGSALDEDTKEHLSPHDGTDIRFDIANIAFASHGKFGTRQRLPPSSSGRARDHRVVRQFIVYRRRKAETLNIKTKHKACEHRLVRIAVVTTDQLGNTVELVFHGLIEKGKDWKPSYSTSTTLNTFKRCMIRCTRVPKCPLRQDPQLVPIFHHLNMILPSCPYKSSSGIRFNTTEENTR